MRTPEGKYIYQASEWPTINLWWAEKGTGFDTMEATLRSAYQNIRVQLPILALNDAQHNHWNFLYNVTQVVNDEIAIANEDAVPLYTTMCKRPLVEPSRNEILHPLRNIWNIIAKLRLLCDGAIIMLSKSPKAAAAFGIPKRFDSIGIFENCPKAVDFINISPDAQYFLQVLNQASNSIKHSIDNTNFVPVDRIPTIFVIGDSERTIKQTFFQPFPDLIAGTSHFVASIFDKII